MRIISNKECYVQGYDLEYLVYSNDISLENKCKAYELMSNYELNKYVKISDKELVECILSNNEIIDFAKYNKIDLKKLGSLSLRLKIDIMNIDDEKGISNNEEYAYEKRKKEYLLKQIKDLIAYRKKQSKIDLPNIPNPCEPVITNGKLGAVLSLDYDNVLIYNLDGSPISGEEDKEFCNITYQLLMRDMLLECKEESIKLESTVDENNKYLSISKMKEKVYQRNYKKKN